MTAPHEALNDAPTTLPRPAMETSETEKLDDGSTVMVIAREEEKTEGPGLVISESWQERFREFGIYPDDIFRFFTVTNLTEEERRRMEARQHYFQARYFLEMEEFAHALGEFKAALEDDTSNPQVMLGMVQANLQLRNFGEARELIEAVLDEQSTNVQALITKAKIILATADSLGGTRRREALGDTVRVLEQAQYVEPQNIETLKLLARAYSAQQDAVRTIQIYRRLVSIDPKDTYSHLMLATMLHQAGRREESAESFKKVIEQRRSFIQGYMALGTLYEEMRRPNDALEIYQNAILAASRHDQLQILKHYEEFVSKLASQKSSRRQPAERDILAYYERFAKAYPHSTEVQRIYAERLIQAKDFSRAVQQYKKMVKTDPDNVEALIAIGNIYNAQKNFDEANRYFAQAININPEKIEIYENIADNFIGQKELPKAVEIYEKALKLNPKLDELYFKLAALLDQTGKTDEAIEALQNGVEHAGAKTEMYARIGQLYEKQKNQEKALENFRKAFELTPADPVIGIKLLSFCLEMGNRDEAAQVVEKMLAAAGDRQKELLPLIGEAYFVIGDVETAAVHYENAIGEVPENSGLVTRLVQLYNKAKQYDKSLLLLEKFEARSPDSPITAKLRVDTYLDQKDIDKAIETAEGIIEAKPDAAESYWDLVEVHVSAEQLEEALAVIKRAEDKLGRTEDSDLRRALTYYRLKKYEPAEKVFRELAQKRTSNASMYYYYIGSIQLDQKRTDAAERSLKRAIEIDPNNDSALNALGYMYADQGRKLSEARQLIEKALQLNPGAGHIMDSMGWVLYKLGKPAEGLEYIERAAKLMGDDAEIFEHLGDIHAAMGQIDKAVEYWRKSLGVDENRQSVKTKLTKNEKKL